MRRLSVTALFASAAVLILSSAAQAATTIEWTGQGSDNLPCSEGGHWVLTGKGITSATMTVNGVEYVMTQAGQGSWSADSVGAIDGDSTASVSYEGQARNPQFVLSHCIAQESPTPTPPPSSTTPPPTTTPPTTPPSSGTHTPSSSLIPPANGHHHHSGTQVRATAQTGAPGWAVGAFIALLGVGLLALGLARAASKENH